MKGPTPTCLSCGGSVQLSWGWGRWVAEALPGAVSPRLGTTTPGTCCVLPPSETLKGRFHFAEAAEAGGWEVMQLCVCMQVVCPSVCVSIRTCPSGLSGG